MSLLLNKDVWNTIAQYLRPCELRSLFLSCRGLCVTIRPFISERLKIATIKYGTITITPFPYCNLVGTHIYFISPSDYRDTEFLKTLDIQAHGSNKFWVESKGYSMENGLYYSRDCTLLLGKIPTYIRMFLGHPRRDITSQTSYIIYCTCDGFHKLYGYEPHVRERLKKFFNETIFNNEYGHFDWGCFFDTIRDSPVYRVKYLVFDVKNKCLYYM